jgi:hypothetical protein
MDKPQVRFLVLGAYSYIGRCIVKGLLEQPECAVVAAGRDRLRLGRMSEEMSSPRLSTVTLDALDEAALTSVCREAEVVINCVGPYIISGQEVARVVVENRKHYVDFAFEQFHYRRLEALDETARANDVALVTAAGEVAGLSSILCLRAVRDLPSAQKLTIIALEGKLHGEAGFSSLMNGALEPALGNQDYVGGRYVPVRMGAEIVLRDFPEPYGRMSLLSDPTIDSLILPQRTGVQTIKSYFGMGMDVPFGFFPLMRFLNPYKNRVFYGLTGGIIRRIMRKSEAHKEQQGTPVAQLLRVEAESPDQRVVAEMRFRSDFNCTAYLPILVGKMLAQGEIRERGLRTAVDVVSPERLFEELARDRQRGWLDWTISAPLPI